MDSANLDQQQCKVIGDRIQPTTAVAIADPSEPIMPGVPTK
jgi:hypothetical protein